MTPVTPHNGWFAEQGRPLDVIIDTDIGTDIDDAYAVLMALGASELNVRGFTLVHADTETRAKILLKLLRLAGREDIPVVAGLSQPLNPQRPLYWGGHEGRGVDFSDVAGMLPIADNAPEFIARTAAEHPGELVLVPIGPLTNVGRAFKEFPREMSALKGIAAMASTFSGFGPGSAGAEHNVRLDPEAARIVLGSGVPTVTVGLNVTMQTSLTRRQLAEIEGTGTELSRYVAHMTNDWLSITGRDGAIMHDSLALAAALDRKVVDMTPVRADVSLDDAGVIAYEADPDSPLMISTSIDVPRFNEVFFTAVLSAVRG